MKRRPMILAGSLLAIAAVATTVITTNPDTEKSLLAQNVEALAGNEESEDYSCCKPYSNECAVERGISIPGVKSESECPKE